MKRVRIIIATLLTCCLYNIALADDKTPPPPYDKSISDAEALDIAEATFRYQFQKNASGAQQKAEAYFLSLFAKDPSPEFLKRFAQHKPPVQKGSEFKVGNGLAFRVITIKRVSETKVEVSGGYYEGNLSSSGNSYFVEKKDGKWVVTGERMHWIS